METALKTPKVVLHHAMMRHFKQCIAGDAKPVVGVVEAMVTMQMIDAIYKSASTGKSVEIKTETIAEKSAPLSPAPVGE